MQGISRVLSPKTANYHTEKKFFIFCLNSISQWLENGYMRSTAMIFNDNELLLSTSPVLIIDDTEAVIVQLDKLNTSKCEHLEVQ